MTKNNDQLVRLTVDVPLKTKRKLEALAKKRDVSLAHLQRRGIEWVLTEDDMVKAAKAIARKPAPIQTGRLR